MPIKEKMAREIASEWHSGQWSGLYSIASCQDYKNVPPTTWHDAYWEARRNAQEASGAGGKKDAQRLTKLADWIEYTARHYGVHVKGSLV